MRLTPSHFHIMLVDHKPSHGYAIGQEVEERTKGGVQLGPGSLYLAIKRLAEAGLLEETAVPSQRSDGPSREVLPAHGAGRARLRTAVEHPAGIVRQAEWLGLIQPLGDG